MTQRVTLDVSVHPLPDDLAPCFTSIYLSEVVIANGGLVSDTLQPEWANIRITDRTDPNWWLEKEGRISGEAFVVTGPSAKAGAFSVSTSRSWGISFSPLGWARFVGAQAQDYANRVVSGVSDPAFSRFAPLAQSLFGPARDPQAEFERIVAFFRACPTHPSRDEARIEAIHQAMIDPAISTVTEMSEATGIAQRTLERMCKRHFGFSTKLLLRRQRFLRGLARFSLDPTSNWTDLLDPGYHDQAHFVRDFREFMGCTPTTYLTQPHPILGYFATERARVYGGVTRTFIDSVGAGQHE